MKNFYPNDYKKDSKYKIKYSYLLRKFASESNFQGLKFEEKICDFHELNEFKLLGITIKNL